MFVVNALLIICLLFVFVGCNQGIFEPENEFEPENSEQEESEPENSEQEESEPEDVLETYQNYTQVTTELLDLLRLDTINKVMIVAHPDDEAIWGGKEILENDYFVVSTTGHRYAWRQREFSIAMQFAGARFLMLDHPQHAQNSPPNYDIYDCLAQDIRTILEYKSWEKIVTFSPTGESGHGDHILVNNVVTDICVEMGIFDKLWYFTDKYYAPEYRYGTNLAHLTPTMTDEMYEKVLTLMRIYESQSQIMTFFSKTVRFQELISAQEWWSQNQN
jgi:LmbE family N-acetylglucosaminyl deacetylase